MELVVGWNVRHIDGRIAVLGRTNRQRDMGSNMIMLELGRGEETRFNERVMALLPPSRCLPMASAAGLYIPLLCSLEYSRTV